MGKTAFMVTERYPYRAPTPYWIEALFELLWEELITKADYDQLVGAEPQNKY